MGWALWGGGLCWRDRRGGGERGGGGWFLLGFSRAWDGSGVYGHCFGLWLISLLIKPLLDSILSGVYPALSQGRGCFHVISSAISMPSVFKLSNIKRLATARLFHPKNQTPRNQHESTIAVPAERCPVSSFFLACVFLERKATPT